MPYNFPTIETAVQMLTVAGEMNPGKWIDHSHYVALACQKLAASCPDLNREKAYIMGLLHDIGRRVGVVANRHMVEGYRFCMAQGWEEVARICITHSFMLQDIRSEIGKWDVTEEEYQFIANFLASVQYDDYDRLVQLCDSLATACGFCLLEQRFVDVARRYGVNEYTVQRWNAVFDLKAYFEKLTGQRSIYHLLPGVRENIEYHGEGLKQKILKDKPKE